MSGRRSVGARGTPRPTGSPVGRNAAIGEHQQPPVDHVLDGAGDPGDVHVARPVHGHAEDGLPVRRAGGAAVLRRPPHGADDADATVNTTHPAVVGVGDVDVAKRVVGEVVRVPYPRGGRWSRPCQRDRGRRHRPEHAPPRRWGRRGRLLGPSTARSAGLDQQAASSITSQTRPERVRDPEWRSGQTDIMSLIGMGGSGRAWEVAGGLVRDAAAAASARPCPATCRHAVAMPEDHLATIDDWSRLRARRWWRAGR